MGHRNVRPDPELSDALDFGESNRKGKEEAA